MIDILLVSSSPDRSRLIGIGLEASGVPHRLRIAHGTARHIRVHAAAIESADLLIVDDVDLSARELSGIEEALACSPQLHCMLVTPGPSTNLLMAAMRVGVRHVLSWPLDPREIVDALTHVANKKTAGARREGRVVSVTSCKGGSGTTLVATNLACTLAQSGAGGAEKPRRVLLIDLNQQFADASLLVADTAPAATIADLCAQIDRLDSAFFDACVMHVNERLDVLAGAGDPVKAADLRPAHLDQLLALARERYDAVVIDVGQSVNPLAIYALDHSDAVAMVVRQDMLYLHAGRRMFDIFRELGYPSTKVQLVVNAYDKRARITLETLETTLGAKIAHRLPRDEKAAVEALNQGVALVDYARKSALAQAIGALADSLWPRATVVKTSALRRLFAARPRPVHQLKTEH